MALDFVDIERFPLPDPPTAPKFMALIKCDLFIAFGRRNGAAN